LKRRRGGAKRVDGEGKEKREDRGRRRRREGFEVR